jgi:hypothetical protein
MMTPNHALRRTAAGHHGYNRRVTWAESLNLGRQEAVEAASRGFTKDHHRENRRG